MPKAVFLKMLTFQLCNFGYVFYSYLLVRGSNGWEEENALGRQEGR